MESVDRILQLSIGEFSRDRVERADALSRTGDPLRSASRDGLHAAVAKPRRTTDSINDHLLKQRIKASSAWL